MQTGEFFAAKIFHKVSINEKSKVKNKKIFFLNEISLQKKESIKREVKILHLLKGHRNILHIIEFFEESDSIILVTELIEGGDLYTKLKKYHRLTED